MDRQSLEQLSYISMEHSVTPMALLSPDLRLVYTNIKMNELLTQLGVPKDQWCQQFFGSKDQLKAFLELVKKENFSSFDKPMFVQKDLKHFLISSYVLYDQDILKGIVLIVRDISRYKTLQLTLKQINEDLEKKNHDLLKINTKLQSKMSEIEFLNEQLEQSNLLLQENSKLFFHGPVTVFKWKNEDGWPVEYVSPNVIDNLGYHPHEFRDPNLYENMVHPEDRIRLSHDVAHRIHKNGDFYTHKPYRLQKKTGEYIWVNDYTMQVTDAQGNIKNYIGYIFDLYHKEIPIDISMGDIVSSD